MKCDEARVPIRNRSNDWIKKNIGNRSDLDEKYPVSVRNDSVLESYINSIFTVMKYGMTVRYDSVSGSTPFMTDWWVSLEVSVVLGKRVTSIAKKCVYDYWSFINKNKISIRHTDAVDCGPT